MRNQSGPRTYRMSMRSTINYASIGCNAVSCGSPDVSRHWEIIITVGETVERGLVTFIVLIKCILRLTAERTRLLFAVKTFMSKICQLSSFSWHWSVWTTNVGEGESCSLLEVLNNEWVYIKHAFLATFQLFLNWKYQQALGNTSTLRDNRKPEVIRHLSGWRLERPSICRAKIILLQAAIIQYNKNMSGNVISSYINTELMFTAYKSHISLNLTKINLQYLVFHWKGGKGLMSILRTIYTKHCNYNDNYTN